MRVNTSFIHSTKGTSSNSSLSGIRFHYLMVRVRCNNSSSSSICSCGGGSCCCCCCCSSSMSADYRERRYMIKVRSVSDIMYKIYVCICVRHRQRQRQRGNETETGTETETDRQTDRERDTHSSGFENKINVLFADPVSTRRYNRSSTRCVGLRWTTRAHSLKPRT